MEEQERKAIIQGRGFGKPMLAVEKLEAVRKLMDDTPVLENNRWFYCPVCDGFKPLEEIHKSLTCCRECAINENI